MGKEAYQFEDFLAEINDEHKEVVTKIHEMLLQDDYKIKIESKASGFGVSYTEPKTKRTILNYGFRKKGIFIRIYAENLCKYAEFFNQLPKEMEKEIDKASVCKRLVNPEDCNPKCSAGYDFFVEGIHYQKCRYSCFQFFLNAENKSVLLDFVENERKARMLAD